MSGESLPSALHIQPWLIVGSPACREQPLRAVRQLGIPCAEADDPYAAMLLICQRPNHYAAVVLSLYSLYREELQIIPALTARFRQLPIWLTHSQGRQSACDEAIRLGAKGLLDMNGAHPAAPNHPPVAAPMTSPPIHASIPPPQPVQSDSAGSTRSNIGMDEPILSAEELRALLEDQPAVTPPGAEV